jgi:endonuclease III
LSRSLSLEGFEDRFGTIREALAILIDHARDPGVKTGLAGLQKGLEAAAAARQATAGRLEELIRATGMPSEGEEFETVRQALGILLERSQQAGIREGLEGLWKQLEAAAAARQATAGRLEELVRATGMPSEGEEFETVRQALGILLERSQQAGIREGLEGLWKQLDAAAAARQATAGRLEELIRTVGLIPPDESRPGIVSQLRDLGEHTASQQERLKTLETRIVERLDLLERLDQRIGAMEERLDQRIGAMEARLDQRIGAMEARLDGRIGAMEARLDRVESGSLKLWMGPIKLGRIGRSAKKD